MPIDSSFVKAPVNVPKLSGFDKSHQNLLTTKCGTITPILIDTLIPGSKVKLDLAMSATLPPLASDTFMRASMKTEAFFIPFRLLSGAFESWFCDNEKQFVDFSGTDTFTSHKGFLPVIGGISQSDTATIAYVSSRLVPGSLSDYLGFGCYETYPIGEWSAMPYLAYHRVFHDWYRNSLIQRDVFLPPTYGANPGISPSSNTIFAGTCPYQFTSDSYAPSYIMQTKREMSLADGVGLLDLRQRNFGLDYFTTATPTAQQGSPETISFSTSGSTGQFSIAALRAANSLQQWKERNNIAGNLYVEQLYARYGFRPSDGVAQRSLFLGSADFEVYSKGIFENAGNATTNNNPFSGQVGTQFGQGRASGSQHLVEFQAKEPGYLLVLTTLVPRVTYSTGIHRRFTDFVGAGCISNLANPILQNVGPQPIYQRELTGDVLNTSGVFGYTDRYAQYKTMEDELHGLLRDGSSLQSFALQRSFALASSPTINSSFLQIPTNYMDQVTNVTAAVSNYGAWVDCYFDYKVSQPLAHYSLPSLQDPAYEHGRTLVINRGGFKL